MHLNSENMTQSQSTKPQAMQDECCDWEDFQGGVILGIVKGKHCSKPKQDTKTEIGTDADFSFVQNALRPCIKVPSSKRIELYL